MLNEKKLVLKLEKILKREFGTNLAFHEFSAGYGIADLVFAKDFSFKRNLISRKPLTNFNSLKMFLGLEDQKSYSLTEILNTFSTWDNEEIKKQIRILLNDGYLLKTEENIYKKILEDSEANPIQKIIAIEVKLTDHRGGLVQARRYQYFADESYLAILKTAEKNIDFEEFNKHNIGLILFDNNTGTIEIKHPRAKNLNHENSVSLFAKEMMLSKFLSLSF